MVSQLTTIVNLNGLHARPASNLVLEAKKFESDITVGKPGEKGANAKSIMQVLTQGLTCGTEIEITANGTDEQTALNSLVALVQSGCGEGNHAG